MKRSTPTTEARVGWDQVLRWRIHRHLLGAERGSDPVTIARRLAGVHAQLAASAATAIGLRATRTPVAIDDALTQRSLVKTWAARGTLHLLPADDLPAWVAALTLRGIETKGAWLRHHGLTADQVRDLLGAIATVLDATPLTRAQLADRVVAATGHKDLHDGLTQGFGALLKPAAARGLLCFGPPQGRQVTFVAPRHWLPRWSEMDADSALERLVLAHLDAYGPAGPEEFGRWFALNPPPVKRAFARLDDRLAWVDLAGHPAAIRRTHLDQLREPPTEPSVHLLPAFDPYVVGSLGHLEQVIAGGERAQVSRPQGWISPTLVVNGQVAGSWESERAGARLSVVVTPFGRLSRATRAGIGPAADRLAAASEADDAAVRVA